jgi:hypothetical protein
MPRISNELAKLPPDVQAVCYRQCARDAEWLAHLSGVVELALSYNRVAAYWRALADELDADNDLCEFGACPARRVGAAPFH